jgi:hypothetical protein
MMTKHLKMLGLFVMAAALMMAFAGSASAAGTFTAPAGTEYTGHLKATLEGSALLKASFAEITCTESIIGGSMTPADGGANNETHAFGKINTVDFTSCGESIVTTVNHLGTLTIRKSDTTVTGTGAEVTVSRFGTSCVYGLGTGTHLGTAKNTGAGVTLPITALLGKISGGFLCGNPATWTANYIVTTPAESVVE